MKTPLSERLSYQMMTRDDAEILHQLDQDPEVMKFINGGKPNSLETITNVFIPRMESYTQPDKGWGLWKASLKESQEFIGWILVRPMDFFSDSPKMQDIELGWRFFQSSWGKGFATEAAQALKEAIINTGQAKQLSAIAIEENYASVNIMMKLGMKFVKKGIHKDPLGDLDVVFYQLEV